MKNLYLFIAGAVSFAACQIIWLTFFNNASSNWVLEPTPGVVLNSIVMILTGSICTYFSRIEKRNLFFLTMGACVSVTIMLFSAGLGNLWPIVLAIDYIMMTVLAVIGWRIGMYFLNKGTTTRLIKNSKGPNKRLDN